LFSGFPWNTFGYALTGPLVLAQAASLVGLWGLTFLAVCLLIGSLVAVIVGRRVTQLRSAGQPA